MPKIPIGEDVYEVDDDDFDRVVSEFVQEIPDGPSNENPCQGHGKVLERSCQGSPEVSL